MHNSPNFPTLISNKGGAIDEWISKHRGIYKPLLPCYQVGNEVSPWIHISICLSFYYRQNVVSRVNSAFSACVHAVATHVAIVLQLLHELASLKIMLNVCLCI